MINNIETEYKVLVTKEQFEKLKSNYLILESRKQVNTYYDTKTALIKKQKYSMRIREVNNQFIFTLKTPHKGAHHEHECLVSQNSVEAFKEPEIVLLFDQYHLHGDYQEIGKCITYRSIYANELAELCFDINEYNGITDFEIEYEMKSDHDGIAAFNQILSAIDCVYVKNCPSKIARTCRL